MIKNIKILVSYFDIKLVFIFLSIFIFQANAETKIIAKSGDTLFKLSKQYEVPLKELMHKNKFNDANKILEGEVIIIPFKKNNNQKEVFTHKVIKGDTLYKIAKNYNVNLKDIITLNNLDNISYLKPDQIIVLPKGAIYKKTIEQRKIKLASKKVIYHQTSKGETLSDIAQIHGIKPEAIVTLNNQTKIIPNTKLKIREKKSFKWLKYGSLIINWSEWRYFNGNYITQVRNKKNKSFYLAISCEKRVLNNTLNNSNWTSWYFPKSDFEFKLIDDFCDNDFNI